MLDDSVSEEEEGSFDELADVTPYLQPGVELSVLNEVRPHSQTPSSRADELDLM